MNYKDALKKLEELGELVEKVYNNKAAEEDKRKLFLLYGEVEEIIHRIGGIIKVEVPEGHGLTSTYQNYIEAGYLSSRTIHRHAGYTQLLKIIGKVRQLANDPSIPQVEYSITQLVQVLRRFRECCQYLSKPLSDEKGVQDIIWIMLRSQYERLLREDTLPRFGSRNYKPDFGVPDLRTLIEVKFIGEKTTVANIQEGILADIPGYLNENTNFDNLIIFVYDGSHKLRDPKKFIEDIKGIDGISEVIIIAGIG